MTRWLAVLALIAAPAAARDSVPPVDEEAVPAPIAEVGFEEFEQRMTVPVEIAGAGPYRFVIDTGAQRTVISRQLATTLGLPPGKTVGLMSMTGRTEVGTVTVPSLKVSVLGGQGIVAPMLEARDMGALGILGIDALQGHSLAIDFDRQTMAIAPSTAKRERDFRDGEEIVVRARSLFGQLVVTNAEVGNTRVRVILDTGSAVTMGNEALRRKVMRNKDGVPIQLRSVTGGMLAADYTALAAIKVGDVAINDLPIAFADAPPFGAFGLKDKPAILLGMDALGLFRRVRIDFAKRELRLVMPRGTLRPSALRSPIRFE